MRNSCFLVLNVDGLSCYGPDQVGGQIDSNCLESVVNSGAVCNICRQGYYLSNGVCVTQNAGDESCFILNFANPSQCFVCMEGFTITNNLNCVVNTDITSGQSADPLSVKVLNAFVAVLLCLLLIN